MIETTVGPWKIVRGSTPGPWTLVEFPAVEEFWVVPDGYDGCGPIIAVVGGIHYNSVHEYIEDIALIVAAPDLLAACEAAVDNFDAPLEGCDCGECEAGRQLRAAIAKAKKDLDL